MTHLHLDVSKNASLLVSMLSVWTPVLNFWCEDFTKGQAGVERCPWEEAEKGKAEPVTLTSQRLLLGEPGKGVGKPALGGEDLSGPASWPRDRQPRSPPGNPERTHRRSLWMPAGLGTVPLPAPNQTLRQSTWDAQGGLLETRVHVICRESSQLFPAAWTLMQRVLQPQPGVGPPLLPRPVPPTPPRPVHAAVSCPSVEQKTLGLWALPARAETLAPARGVCGRESSSAGPLVGSSSGNRASRVIWGRVRRHRRVTRFREWVPCSAGA